MGVSRSSDTDAITIPGVQNPHCNPCSARNARCMGCSWPSGPASPSRVVTCRPSAWAARIVHDFTDSPSSSTVHAPQEVVSQPMLVAVSPAVSRRKCASSVRSSTSAATGAPFTISVTFTNCLSPR